MREPSWEHPRLPALPARRGHSADHVRTHAAVGARSRRGRPWLVTDRQRLAVADASCRADERVPCRSDECPTGTGRIVCVGGDMPRAGDVSDDAIGKLGNPVPILVRNNGGTLLELWLEPYGQDYWLQPGEAVIVISYGPSHEYPSPSNTSRIGSRSGPQRSTRRSPTAPATRYPAHTSARRASTTRDVRAHAAKRSLHNITAAWSRPVQ